MRKRLKKIMILFFTFSLIIFPFNNFSVSAASKQTSFFEVDCLRVSQNENIIMTINLNLIDYDEFNFKLISNKYIQNIETDESIELISDSNEEVSFNFNKNNSNLKQITLKYELSDSIIEGDIITFKAVVSDNTNEETELLEDEYEVLITVNKTDNDIKDKIDDNKNIENDNNFNDKEINVIDSSKLVENVSEYSNINNDALSNDSQDVKVVTYNGSDNNYLSNLSITGYTLNNEFSNDRLTYFVTVESDITSLDINATAENESSIVSINGNTDLKDGLNKILITVTAENGNTKNYRIYVTKGNQEA